MVDVTKEARSGSLSGAVNVCTFNVAVEVPNGASTVISSFRLVVQAVDLIAGRTRKPSVCDDHP